MIQNFRADQVKEWEKAPSSDNSFYKNPRSMRAEDLFRDCQSLRCLGELECGKEEAGYRQERKSVPTMSY